MTTAQMITLAVVAGRFLLPLAIIRWPLPAILACLLLDGVDQTIFQALGEDSSGYQGYDKAMDVFYLAMAYVAMLRNWTSGPAFQIGRALYLYRLVGVVAFELAQWRPLLVIFANTFEYFFIAYELVRTRWDPTRYAARTWLLVAAGIWVVIKIPQESWIHLFQLDITDEMAAHGWLAPLVVAVAFGAFAVVWTVLLPRLGAPSWAPRLTADPLPTQIDEGWERDQWVATHGRVRSMATLEKVVLVGLICVVFSQVLQGLRVNSFELLLGTAVFVVLNAALALWAARTARTRESVLAAFVSRLVVNIGLLLVVNWRIGEDNVNLTAGIFYLVLLSLLTTLHDRYWPVHAVRMELSAPDGGGDAALDSGPAPGAIRDRPGRTT